MTTLSEPSDNGYTRDQIVLVYDAYREDEDDFVNLCGIQPLLVDPKTQKVQSYQALFVPRSLLNDSYWRDIDLSGSQFSHSFIARATFRKCILDSLSIPVEGKDEDDILCTDFSKARIYGLWEEVKGHNTQFVNTNFAEVVMKRCWFEQANFSQSSFFRAQMQKVWIRQSQLDRARLIDVQAPGAVLTDNNFRSANFSYSNLWRANLSGCECEYTDFTGTDLTEVKMVGTALAWANMTGVLFGEGNVEDSVDLLEQADLPPIKAALYTLLAQADQEGKREQMQRYRDLLATMNEETVPDFFQVMGWPTPSEEVKHMRDIEVAVKHFFAGMIPILDEDGKRHPSYTDKPIRMIVQRWMTDFMADTYELL